MEINEIIIYMIYICHYIERRNLNTKGEPEGIKTVRECNTKRETEGFKTVRVDNTKGDTLE